MPTMTIIGITYYHREQFMIPRVFCTLGKTEQAIVGVMFLKLILWRQNPLLLH